VLTRLLFKPTYTIAAPFTQTVLQKIHIGQLWCFGIGISVKGHEVIDNPMFDQHRTTVLHCLLVCFSQAIYRPQSEYASTPNPWLEAMVREPCSLGSTLFYSLLNTVYNFDPSGVVPYSYTAYPDTKEQLVDAALQLLLVLLDYRSPAQACALITDSKSSAGSVSPDTHVLRPQAVPANLGKAPKHKPESEHEAAKVEVILSEERRQERLQSNGYAILLSNLVRPHTSTSLRVQDLF
jgi:hypothetical protein